MIICVNGDSRTVPENCSALQLIELLEIQNDRVAMEVNLEIVPRSHYPTYIFKAGDNIEIVRAIGGGAVSRRLRHRYGILSISQGGRSKIR